MRELAALNGAEMLPWDVWGLMSEDLSEDAAQGDYGELVRAERHTLLDKVSRALVEDDDDAILSLYRCEPGLAVPEELLVAGR